jgi:AraC family transcriptional regulator of adaptative response/methylated-DNA-[protein]-cysteine methyltransferase
MEVSNVNEALALRKRQNTLNRGRIDEEGYWQAVVNRDSGYDGKLFFGVRSTGIYCRPSCPAKRPRREQVVFFQLPEIAERAGFRSCKRCQPRNVAAGDPQVEMVRRACKYIEDRRDKHPTLEDLSVHTGVSAYHLQRIFKRIVGISPRQYADAMRLEQFKTGVKNGATVTGAMYDAGYGSSSRLYESAHAKLGMTPADYRRGGKEMKITYAIVDCALGRLLVAGTEKGICAVRLGDTDETLEANLFNEFPAARVNRDDEGLGGWVEQISNHLNGNQRRLELPLDVQATAFQWSVWEKLREIPYGSTRSYSEVARAMGRPSATRAVARACATNPVALVIPCHRVVREDKSLGGYRWGIERKKALLKQEASRTGK